MEAIERVMISEDDFNALASAAQRAKDAGEADEAQALDKLARKANAALANDKYRSAGAAGASPRNAAIPDTPESFPDCSQRP